MRGSQVKRHTHPPIPRLPPAGLPGDREPPTPEPETGTRNPPPPTLLAMHYDTHQNVIDDLEARILTIRDSL